MIEKEVQELLSFIDGNPTAYHTTASVRNILLKEGFSELLESRRWQLEPGRSYFVCRNGSSILAFRMGEQLENYSFNVAAAHTDSPCFRIKENAEIHMGRKYTKLNTEGYGGMICSTWMDRPLSVAGRVLIKENDAITSRLLTLDRDLLMIPSVAIHMNRSVNEGVKLDTQKDTLPLLGGSQADLKSLVAESAGVNPQDILSWDLYLYSRTPGTVFGAEGEYIAAPRLDDLECVFAGTTAFLQAENPENVTVLALFDNEETGSLTRQGADSPFLSHVLERICLALGKSREELLRAVAGGFMLSADNAHAVHPDSPEKSDPTNRCYLNGGVVVKHSPRYATDAMTAGIFQRICEKVGVPVQVYYNNSKIPGGGTLGNLSGSHVSLPTVDIGLPQLSMHSPYETAGARDLEFMVRAMKACYEASITVSGRDAYTLSC